MTAIERLAFYWEQFPHDHPDHDSDTVIMSDNDLDRIAKKHKTPPDKVAWAKHLLVAAREEQRLARERPDLAEAHKWVQTRPRCLICDKGIVDAKRQRLRRALKEPKAEIAPMKPNPDVVAALALGGDPPRYRVIGGVCDRCLSSGMERVVNLLNSMKWPLAVDSEGVEIGEPLRERCIPTVVLNVLRFQY